MPTVGWAEFKPHLRGSLEPGPNQKRTASHCPSEGSWGPVPNPAAACWPLCKVSGSVDMVPEPSGCTQPPSLSSCDCRQAALSAASCECSLPDRRKKPAKTFGAPTHPTVAPPREGRWHLKSRVERGLPSKAEARHHSAFPEEFWRTAASCTWQ